MSGTATPGAVVPLVVDGHLITRLDADNAHTAIAFSDVSPLAFADVASIATLMPAEPAVWLAHESESTASPVVAAAIDDGLAISVGGDHSAITALARFIGQRSADKLVIAGREADVHQFLAIAAEYADISDRSNRPEHLMAVSAAQLRVPAEPVPLRLAVEDDLGVLREARRMALAEEYAMPVAPDSQLAQDLYTAVARAVSLSGVAIWVEDNRVAFTAQLIAKTPHAAMFGDLYTDPLLRGAGRATRALTTFCTWLMTESERVTLRVGASNTPAVKLYERVGFEVIEPFLSSVRQLDS